MALPTSKAPKFTPGSAFKAAVDPKAARRKADKAAAAKEAAPAKKPAAKKGVAKNGLEGLLSFGRLQNVDGIAAVLGWFHR
jgi:hypothetical protein